MVGPDVAAARHDLVDPTVGAGAVTCFDDRAGAGRIATAAGVELDFHCTALADGARSVPVGARVAFRVVPAHGGRWQAAGVVVV